MAFAKQLVQFLSLIGLPPRQAIILWGNRLPALDSRCSISVIQLACRYRQEDFLISRKLNISKPASSVPPIMINSKEFDTYQTQLSNRVLSPFRH